MKPRSNKPAISVGEMKIQELEPMPWMLESKFWDLVKENEKHYLSVACENSFVSFDLVIELNEEEREYLRTMGWVFAQYLACHVNTYSKEYQKRDIKGTLREQIEKVIINQRKKT